MTGSGSGGAGRPPAAPQGVGTAGQRLWTAITSEFALAEHELTMLRQAVRVTDLCDLLQARVDGDGVLLDERVHPALVELRAQRLLLARLLVALRVPMAEEDAAADDASLTERGRLQRRGLRGFYSAPGGAA